MKVCQNLETETKGYLCFIVTCSEYLQWHSSSLCIIDIGKKIKGLGKTCTWHNFGLPSGVFHGMYGDVGQS